MGRKICKGCGDETKNKSPLGFLCPGGFLFLAAPWCAIITAKPKNPTKIGRVEK
jgi:hypothetical protein